MEEYEVAIQCRHCRKLWKIFLPLSGTQVGVIAAVCECGSIVVGNYNRDLILKHIKTSKDKLSDTTRDEMYLSNGNFDFIELSPEELAELPQLPLE